MHLCHRCKTPWVSSVRIPGVKECCEKCSAYLHSCKNCKHHDLSRPNQCYIPNTEAVADREGANFCDEFEFAEPGGAAKAEAAPDGLEALFGPRDPGVSAKKLDKFKDLFGD